MQRRGFLTLLAAAPLLAAGRGGLWAAPAGHWERSLVLVELKGGNDGLNTVVPWSDPLYHKARPRLALAESEVLKLDGAIGLHPALAPLLPSWKEGELAIVQGLGYPAPNRSHFRSIEIWETASDSSDYLDQGWLTRQLAGVLPPGFTADGLVLGPGDSGPLLGGRFVVLGNKPEVVVRQAQRLPAGGEARGNPALEHILAVRRQLRRTGAELAARAAEVALPDFPKSDIGRQLREAAGLLVTGAPAPVLKLTLGSFDTHQNQRATHERLLGDLAEALATFRAALQGAKLWDRTLVMTYSEFGRRVAENGSGGTDHGTAAPHFLLGGKVRGGLQGDTPSLTALNEGDLRFTTDFRRLYATVAEQWWGVHQTLLAGRHFEPLTLIG